MEKDIKQVKTKRLAVIGKGTAGSLAVGHFCRWLNDDVEIEWYFDPNIKPQSVGEGSGINLGTNLYYDFEFTFTDLPLLDGNYKAGIKYQNWSHLPPFFHDFVPANVAIHFNASKLQDYIFEKVKDKVIPITENVTHEDIDADWIFDCSGTPTDFEDIYQSKYIPVNSVYVNQCYWDHPEFDYTLTIARPHGWVFGIPLANRCSIGYLYNKDISTYDEVLKDVENVYDEYGLTPSEDTNSFSFKNYYRENTCGQRVTYSGNASFFLEPMEATSIPTMNLIQRGAFDIWVGGRPVSDANNEMLEWNTGIENIIMMHYFAGSRFKSSFWDYAQSRGKKCMQKALTENKFLYFVQGSKEFRPGDPLGNKYYSAGWQFHSFKQNIEGLGIKLEG